MPTVPEFWSDSHHGNAFGIKGPFYGPNGHRGDDTNGWRAGVGIPSFVEGIVVRSGWLVGNEFRDAARGTSGLGWVVVVWCARLGLWFGFCHLTSKGLSVGAVVNLGTIIGPIGSTGSLASGTHVHVTASATSPNPATAAVIDPRQWIRAGRTAWASGDSTPIPNEPEEASMTDFLWLVQDGKPSADGSIQPKMSWYQEAGGAPCVLLDVDYTKSSERTALVNNGVKETGISGDGMLALIQKRGLGPLRPSTGGGGSDPALLAAVQALGPKLDAVVAATNRLNPPG